MQEGMSKINKIKIIIARMLAVFIANGLAVIGAGSLIGVDTVSSVLLAGSLGVIKVAESLARAYIDDGKITLEEINDSFGTMEKKK
jgi:hypothetical protein|tara:strand:- start:3283 stop:3540 length:258 start_codon:yes stop_codon:yes gene_type:complete